MDKKPSTPPAKRQGFSLVLALVMAAALVIVIIVLAAFLKVESRLAINSVLMTRARLNTVASLRLAQGSMQQMLGPDTRITAPSSAFDDNTSSEYDYPLLGVWRSWEGLDHETGLANYLGRPLQRPDYNLKATDNYDTLLGKYNPRGRFLGWLTSNSYKPLVVPAEPAPLPPPLPMAARFKPTPPAGGTFNGLFNSPKGTPPVVTPTPPEFGPVRKRKKPAQPGITAAPAQLPLWTNSGSLAALLSPRLAYTSPLVGANTASGLSAQVTLPAQDFLASLTNQPSDGTFAWWVAGENQKALVSLDTPPTTTFSNPPSSADVLEATRRARTFGTVDFKALGLTQPTTALTLPSRASFDAAVKSGVVTVSAVNKAGFHDYTTYSPGLLINVANGGFRRDLSLLAETWDHINEVDSGRDVRLPLFRYRPKITAATTAVNGADLLYGRPLLDTQNPPNTGNKGRKALLYWWSDYSNIGGRNIAYNDGGTYRGLSFIPPVRSWNNMVDFMLQYRKAVIPGSAAPNGVIEMRSPSVQGTTNASNPLFNYHETTFRHPVVARMQFIFSAGATTDGAGKFRKYIVLHPVVTMWNPYNVRLKVPDISLRIKADQLPVAISEGLYVDPMVVIGAWFNQKPGSNWSGLVFNLKTPTTGVMELNPGETRVYSITDRGTVPGARMPASRGYVWAYGGKDMSGSIVTSGGVDQYGNPVAPDSIAVDLKPGYVPGYNFGSGIWLMWRGDEPSRGGNAPATVFQLRKFNTGRDAIGMDIILGEPGWARSTPVRFGFGGEMFSDSSIYLFRSMYGPDEYAGVPGSTAEFLAGDAANPPTIRAFGTFAFGMRMANDGSVFNNSTLLAKDVNAAGFVTAGTNYTGIVSRGMLQSSPFTCYTELGDKSAEVLVYDKDQFGDSGRDPTKQNGIRYFGCGHPINAPFDLWWRPLSGWSDSYVPQVLNPSSVKAQGYVVSGIDSSTGLNTAVVAEMPVAPLQSLADLQGWDARGFNPAPPFIYGLVGNSDASPILPADDVVGRWFNNAAPDGKWLGRNTPPQFLQHDDRYCLNHVLFDDWFVSSLAPDFALWSQLNDDSKGLATVTALKASWAKAIDGSAPLANRVYRPTPNAAELDLASRDSVTWTAPNVFSNPTPATAGGPRIPDAWLRLGAYLTVNGQFNVNSTSVPAWRAVLGSLRDQRIPVLAPTSSSATMDNKVVGGTSLVRMLPSPETLSGTSRAADLTGYAALTDAQLDALAVEIVNQIRIRGPFLSLSEFVNRQLAVADGTAVDPVLRGALQAALEVLQQVNVTEKNSLLKKYNPWLGAAKHGKATTQYTDPRLDPAGFSADYINPLASVGNSSEGLPGWPRQADLLRRLAPIMSVRDETFTVRALGEVMTAEGTARAWCEAVYQRVPEYVDPRIEPWKAPMGDFIPVSGVYPGEPPARTFPYMANAVFGRRLKLVSFRWLRADEI